MRVLAAHLAAAGPEIGDDTSVHLLKLELVHGDLSREYEHDRVFCPASWHCDTLLRSPPFECLVILPRLLRAVVEAVVDVGLDEAELGEVDRPAARLNEGPDSVGSIQDA